MLKGKVAVVTGAGRGIGRAVALKLAGEGVSVALIASRDSDELENTKEDILKLGVRAECFIADVSDKKKVSEAAKQIKEYFGGADILVNNAGITRDNLLLSMKDEEIDDVIDVNLKGTICVTRAFIGNFVKRRSGVIINISSVVGLSGNRGQSVYAASKAGIVGFTKSVAKEYGKKNIRCNAIAPGFIDTDMTRVLSMEIVDEAKKQTVLGRLGSAEDVANAVAFLADEASAYITGEVIKVDGGLYV